MLHKALRVVRGLSHHPHHICLWLVALFRRLVESGGWFRLCWYLSTAPPNPRGLSQYSQEGSFDFAAAGVEYIMVRLCHEWRIAPLFGVSADH
jgi:hypothetical protein